MDGHDLEPGLTLAGRYRIEDLVGEVAGSQTWRAMDTILNRSVGIQALRSDDMRTVAFLEAARQSTAVPDPRFLRVLDAVADEAGMTYVVREWTRAVQLAVLLREGPLGNRRAATVVGEVADAIARAHEVGVYHQRIDPATILVKDNGAIRITGLGTDHALHPGGAAPRHVRRDDDSGAAAGPPSSTEQALQAEQVDVAALGRVLYACLVARWPGGSFFGLSPAPTEHGRLLRPRQVRAGVSRDVDAVCDRILGDPPRHHAPPLRGAREIAQAIALAGDDDAQLVDPTPSGVGQATGASAMSGNPSRNDRPPALLGSTAATADPTSPAGSLGRRGGATARALVAIGVALLVALAAVLAFFVGRNSVEPADRSDGSPTSSDTGATAAPRPLPPQAVSDFDPQGDLTENPELAPYAIDGRDGTSWTTSQYAGNPKLGGLKNGVGLLVDLGSQKQVTSVDVSFGASPTRYQVWATASGTAEVPTQLSQLRKLRGGTATGDIGRVRFGTPVTTRFVLVWLTSLPEESPGLYRGLIRDISVEGTG